MVAITLALGVGVAGAQQLGDPGFEALAGKPVPRAAAAGWSIPAGATYADGITVTADAAAAHSGATGIKLAVTSWGRLAAVRQSPTLPVGVYDLRVWAQGDGSLTLVAGHDRRRGVLGKTWAQYSLTFAVPAAGAVDLTILTDSKASVDDVTLEPLTGDRLAAWQKQEAARAEYGFVPEYLSAQLPQPGAPGPPTGGFETGRVVWGDRAVFYDERYESVWSTHPEVLAKYLSANGFSQLNALTLADWMKKWLWKGAYGTVVVMTQGLTPASVLGDEPLTSLIRQYLERGGRVVWVGDVPFYYTQDETHPQVFSKSWYNPLLGVRGDWSVGCWGNQGDPQVTPLGQSAGLTEAGGSAIAAYPEDVTAALSGFYSDYAGADLAVRWFKNFNPLMPYSGFLYVSRAEDMSNPALQQAVYRMALWGGPPVTAPAGISPAEAAAAPALKVTLDAPRNRHYYLRGEVIPVLVEATGQTPATGATKVFLQRDGTQFGATEGALPTKDTPVQAKLATADLACGEYRLLVFPASGVSSHTNPPLYETTITLCPVRPYPGFFFGVTGTTAKNPYRQGLLLQDLVDHHMDGGATTETPAGFLDLATKYGVRLSMRAHGADHLTDAEREAALRRGPNGEKLPGAWEGGRPILGLLSAPLRAQRAADMARQVKELAAWPTSLLYCHTNDDFSMYYGYDWSELARRTFQEKTGLDAPVPPELAKLGPKFGEMGVIAHAPGVIPDDDPWLQWNIFCSKDIGGGYNGALTATCVAAAPGVKVGPVPGGMQLPLCAQGQYPPHDFGPGGFNLVQYYYYLNYWQPTLGNLYWNEVGRMGNRDLEVWAMPDCVYQPNPAYYRNTFCLQVAGGAQGLSYYSYGEASPVAWAELGRLGNTVVKPLQPFLGKLRPARTGSAFLIPYTQWCYNWLYPTSALYPYANLLGAHLDVQPTCEEEILSGDAHRYKTIFLWRVQYLRASVVTALEKYIAGGGTVVCDATTSVPIKGAVQSSVDLAMGAGKSNPDPSDPRLGGPGIRDYLHPATVTAVREGLVKYAPPWADCAEPTVVLRRHEFGGVTYLWAVNVESQEEYEYLRDRLGAGAQPADPAKAKQEAIAYLNERAEGQRLTVPVTIPAGNWAAYDVLRGRRLPLTKAGDRQSLTVDMERFGGTLIALYPEPVGKLMLQTPASVQRGQSTPLRVTVQGVSGQPLAGTQPLAVEIVTPQGTWVELTGAYATEAGVWTATFSPARNDPAGTWRVRVKELTSGVAAEGTIVVK
jgi:hypothetical protein